MSSRKSTTTGEEIPDAYILDYAPTGRAACKKCGSNIGENSVRLAKKVRSRFHDGFDLQYMHWRCGSDLVPSLDGFVGWQRLKWVDIEKCLISKDESLPDADSEKVIFAEKRNIWVNEATDQLAAAPVMLLKTVLEANGIVFSDKAKGAELASILADQMLFGKLPPCPTCNNNSLRQEGTDYRCHGWFSASTKCTFRFRLTNILLGGPGRVGGLPVGDEETIARLTRSGTLTLPEEASAHKIFKAFKVPKELLLELKRSALKGNNLLTGSIPAKRGTAGLANSALELLDSDKEEDTIPSEHRLLGIRVCFLGCPEKKRLAPLIEESGGEVQDDISIAGKSRTTHLVVGEDELDKDPKAPRYQSALDAGIPIVFEKFIDAILEDDSGSKNVTSIVINGRKKKNSQINGDYVLVKDKIYSGRPVYLKVGKKSDLYIFYCLQKSKWKINPRISSDSGQIAYNKDTTALLPHLCKEAWVFFDGKDEGFNQDEDVAIFAKGENISLAKGIALRQRKMLRKYLVDGALGKKLPKISEVLKEIEREKNKTRKRPPPIVGSPLLTVDEECDLSGASIYVDTQNNAFNAYLTRTDTLQNVNKFYALQLLMSGSGKYSVFRKWGRVGGGIGKINDSLLNKFRTDKRAAIEEFEKKFEELTGYKFSDRDGAQQKPGRYAIVELNGQDGSGEMRAHKRKKNDDSTLVCNLPTPVRILIETIFDSEMVEHQMMKQMDIDTSQLPLNALSKRQIEQGMSVLKEIFSILNNRKEEKTNKSVQSTSSQLLELKLRDATNRFFTLIPHKFGKTQVVPLIDTDRVLKKKTRCLEDLLSIVDFNAVKSEASHMSGKHICDLQYERLGCSISPLNHGEGEYAWIDRYVNQTHAPTHNTYKLHVAHVLAVDRPDEIHAYRNQPIKHNRQMLWHGSRMTNWVSILSQGLRIAPKEAPSTGYMFGKGIYLADSSSKSANYCFASPENPFGVLALCEVALGDTYIKLEGEYEAAENSTAANCHSTWGVGQSAPTVIEEVEDGALVPIGELGPNSHLEKAKAICPKESPSLLYNEFIVYKTNQLRIKYLVFVKFDFTSGNLWD